MFSGKLNTRKSENMSCKKKLCFYVETNKKEKFTGIKIFIVTWDTLKLLVKIYY